MTKTKLMTSAALLGAALLLSPAFAADLVPTETGVETGTPGVAAYERGDVNYAHTIFKWEEARMPNNAMVQYNLATTYSAMGDKAKASDYYHQVTETGRGLHPTIIDQHQPGVSLSEAACQHLRSMGETCSL